MKSIGYYVSQPSKMILGIVHRFWFLFSDKSSLKIQYKAYMGRKLNLKNPTRFSEKIQWLKLYNRKPQYTTMVDKIAVKDYVANIIGNQYIIPTLGTWHHFDEIDFNTLPDKFVLKTNHGGGGGGVVICKDKKHFNKERAKAKLEQSLKQSIYRDFREWPYKNVKPMILAEQMLEENGEHGLMDYKVFCCNGEPKCIKVNFDISAIQHTYFSNWYTTDWEYINGTTIDEPTNPSIYIKKPQELNILLGLAKTLSRNIPYLRVDFYIVGGKIYFGELTFFPGSGFDPYKPDSFDTQIGSWIKLPEK